MRNDEGEIIGLGKGRKRIIEPKMSSIYLALKSIRENTGANKSKIAKSAGLIYSGFALVLDWCLIRGLVVCDYSKKKRTSYECEITLKGLKVLEGLECLYNGGGEYENNGMDISNPPSSFV